MVLAIVRKEILGSGRHGRYYAIRGAYLALLACITIPSLMSATARLRDNPYAASHFGKDFTIAFGILQFILVVLLAPAFSIGTIAIERATGGLDLLHAAGVGPLRIVGGKFAARMAWLALFIASGMPLFFAGTLMGGAGGESVALLGLHCLFAGALATAIGFTLSGGMKQSVPALVLSYLVLVAIYVGVPLALVFYSEGVVGNHVPDVWFAWISPMAAVVQFCDGGLKSSVAWRTLIAPAAIAFLALLPSLRFAGPLRETGRGFRGAVTSTGGRNDAAAPLQPLSARRSVTIRGNPIAWRDARSARRTLSARILRATYFILGFCVIGGSVWVTVERTLNGLPWTFARVFSAMQGNSGTVRDLARISIFVLLAGAGLVALITASGMIAEERERKAMPLLKLSRLTGGEVLFGKLWGLGVYLWPVALLPLVEASLFFLWRRPMDVALTALLLLAVLLASTGTGLIFSAMCRKAASAAGLAVGFTLCWTIVPVIVAEFLRLGHSFERMLMIVDPLMSVIEVLDRFGNDYSYGYAYDYGYDAWYAILGLGLQVAAGTGMMAIAWAMLETSQEDA